MENEKSGDAGALLAAPAEFQSHRAPVSGKFELLHGAMLNAPKSVMQLMEHLKCTTAEVHALNVPAAHDVCCVDPAGQKAPFPQKACTVGVLQKLPSEQVGQVELAAGPLENVPVPHAVQASLRAIPKPVEKDPGLQLAQAPLVGMEVPVWNVPAWQSWQVLPIVAPLAVEKVPA